MIKKILFGKVKTTKWEVLVFIVLYTTLFCVLNFSSFFALLFTYLTILTSKSIRLAIRERKNKDEAFTVKREEYIGYFLLFTVLISAMIYVFYPHSLTSIVGHDILNDDEMVLSVRVKRLEGNSVYESENTDKAREIVNFLESYRYQRPLELKRKSFDDVNYYRIAIIDENENRVIFSCNVFGNQYLYTIDKYRYFTRYEVFNDTFDIELLERLCMDFSTNNPWDRLPNPRIYSE